MSKQISSLSVGLFGNISNFASSMKSAITPVKNLAGSFTSAGATLLKFTGIGAAVAAGMDALTHIGDGFKFAAELEKTQLQFSALIGDSEKAKGAIEDLTNFAKSTPFEMTGLIDASRELLAFGVSNEKLLPSLKAIGDVAAGVGQPLDEVVAIFGRVAEEGTLSERELRQFAKAGIPVVGELAKQFGVTKEQVKGLATDGKISFSNLQKAFADMTGPAGKFNGQMEKQAGSLGGLWTRLKGATEEALGGIAETLITAFNLKGGISVLSTGLAAAGNKVKQFIAFVAPVLRSIATHGYDAFTYLYNRISPVVAAISNFVGNAWSRLAPMIAAAATSIFDAATSVWNTIYGYVAPIVSAVYQVIADNWQATLLSVTGYVFAIWDVISSIWGVIVELATMVWNGVTAVWQWGAELITGHTTTAADTISGAFQGIVSVSNWLRDVMTTVFTTLGYVVSHWKEGIVIVGLEVALAFVKIGNEAEYIFGTVIPAIGTWFVNNWKELLMDNYNLTMTIFGNMAGNIVNIIKNIPGLIAGTVNFSDLWTPLTTGFTSALKELPNIPAREMGGLEAALTSEVSDLEQKYGQGLGEHLADKAEQAKQVAAGITKTFKELNATPPAPKAPKAPELPKIVPHLTPDNLLLSITPEIKKAKALRVGSAEAQLARIGISVKGTEKNAKVDQQKPKKGQPPNNLAAAKPVQPLPVKPPVPQPPKWDREAEGAAAKQATLDKQAVDIAKDSNYWIRQQYQNGTKLQIASFA